MLEYTDAGDGPALLLLHAFPLGLFMWDPQVEALAAKHRVVRFDARGFGAVVAATGLVATGCVAMGFSAGGLVATGLAATALAGLVVAGLAVAGSEAFAGSAGVAAGALTVAASRRPRWSCVDTKSLIRGAISARKREPLKTP